MTRSENSSNTSPVRVEQLPLQGHFTPRKVTNEKRESWIEGMGNGRFRIHILKKRL